MDEETFTAVLEEAYGEHTISFMARIIHKVLEDFGTRNLIEALQKLV